MDGLRPNWPSTLGSTRQSESCLFKVLHCTWVISCDSYHMTHTVIMTQYNSCSREFLKARRDLTFYCEILPFLLSYSNYSVARFVILNTNLAIVIIAAASKYQIFGNLQKYFFRRRCWIQCKCIPRNCFGSNYHGFPDNRRWWIYFNQRFRQ